MASYETAQEGQQVSPPDAGAQKQDDQQKITRWLDEVNQYEKEAKVWQDRSKKIVKRYKDERGPYEDGRRRFNILWSNVQTLLPALYSRNPKPDIQRRFKDADPLGRVASSILERSVSFFCETDQFAAAIRQATLDYLLPGRGAAWVRYDPTLESDEAQITDDVEAGDASPAQKITFEDVRTDYVHAADFGHNICRTYEEVWLVWRKVYMTRAEQVKRFGNERGNLAPLDHGNRDDKGKFTGQIASKSTIYEAWDKQKLCASWFHKDIPESLDYRSDPLGLPDFFPCPKPMFANLANDSLIPTPDYLEYQDQADELDALTGRIHSIQKALKVAGVYDSSAAGIARLLSEGFENQLIPVDSWAVFADKGGIKGSVDFLPIEEVAATLAQLYNVRTQVKEDLYEITGIADIIRGVSDPNETMGAQQIKSNFATMRLSDRQGEVQRFVREIVRIMVAVICNHFQIETIKKISGVQLFTEAEKQMAQQMAAQAQTTGQPPQIPPQYKYLTIDQIQTMMTEPSWEEVEKLLRDQPMREFRIDIETDSTIKTDQAADKQSRMEFLKAASDYLAQAVPAGAQEPQLVPLLSQLLMFGVRSFPVGKELEGAFNMTLAKLEKQAQAAEGRPKSDPATAKIQADAQAKQQQMQSDAQLEQQKMQQEMQLEQAKAQLQAQSDQQRNELEAGRDQARLQSEQNLAQTKMKNEMALEQFKIQSQGALALKEAHIKAAASIEVARIAASQDSGEQAEYREQEFEDDGTPKNTPKAPTGHELVAHALGQVANATVSAAQQHQQTQAQLSQMAQQHQQMMQQHAANHAQLMQAHATAHAQNQQTTLALMRAMMADKEVVRDPKTGRAIGVRAKAAMN